MCINRWCSETPKKTTPELTTLTCTDEAEFDICRKDYDRNSNTCTRARAAAFFQKFQPFPFFKKNRMSFLLTFSNIAAESGSLPPLNAAEEVGETVSDAGAKY